MSTSRAADGSKIGRRSKLEDGDIRVIRWRVKKGDDRMEIAKEYGVSRQTIDKIYWRHTFANVPDDARDEMEEIKQEPITEKEQSAADASLQKILAFQEKLRNG